jgi:hypothetical protein
MELSKYDSPDPISLVYVENAKVAATFWEWRSKVMERFFAAMAGVAFAEGWIYARKELHSLLFIPLLLGAIFSIVSLLMDDANRRILLGCYATGKELERQLGPVRGRLRTLPNTSASLTTPTCFDGFTLAPERFC